MEFWKHAAGISLLVISTIVIIGAVWYLMFRMPESPAERGGVLVNQMMDTEMTML